MFIEIDDGSGFCFGVTTAIKKAEEELAQSESLCCLGDIVHNGREVERLKNMGLITVGHADLDSLHDTKMLLRAHGEPPQTYAKAKQQNISLIDATCPVVLNLQKRIRKAYEEGGQIVIYGKNGHAEVVGLVGQTDGTAIVIENLEDATKLDFTNDSNHQIIGGFWRNRKIHRSEHERRCTIQLFRHHLPTSRKPHPQHHQVRSTPRCHPLRMRQEKFKREGTLQPMSISKSLHLHD